MLVFLQNLSLLFIYYFLSVFEEYPFFSKGDCVFKNIFPRVIAFLKVFFPRASVLLQRYRYFVKWSIFTKGISPFPEVSDFTSGISASLDVLV